MKIRPMTLADIPNLKLEAGWMYDRCAMYLENQTGPAWIMEDEAGPLAAYGAAFLWDGVCEVWFNLIRKEKTVPVVRALKKFIGEQSEKLGIWRMHATIKCSFEPGKRFIEWLGFTYEATMKRYNPDGSDAFLYSRVI